MKNYYDILGVSRGCCPEELKRAYHSLAKRFHPDMLGGDKEAFQELNRAYATLSSPILREEYDREFDELASRDDILHNYEQELFFTRRREREEARDRNIYRKYYTPAFTNDPRLNEFTISLMEEHIRNFIKHYRTDETMRGGFKQFEHHYFPRKVAPDLSRLFNQIAVEGVSVQVNEDNVWPVYQNVHISLETAQEKSRNIADHFLEKYSKN